MLNFLYQGLLGSSFNRMLSSAISIIWRRNKNKSPNLEGRLDPGVTVFSYKELIKATKNFSPSRRLGEGGFAAVYYGKLKDMREVAVKRLHKKNHEIVEQFMNEVNILGHLRHPNLVLFYGCTSQESRELLLVYEYIPNGTITDHLHGKQAIPGRLTWPIRLKIAIETASALVYLHARDIIHQDVKTNNILLDNNFNVKVADFGLSRLFPVNVNFNIVLADPQGTPGYVAPEYYESFQLSDKSDVYSFGVVLIELISSMAAVDKLRPREDIYLANLARNRIQRCEIDQLIDPALVSDSNPEIKVMITSAAELAYQCLQFDLEMRPTMNEVLDLLMEIQAGRRMDVGDLESVNPPPLSEINDSVVLLKEFPPSPISMSK
ncbi:putative transferase, protein kinase RLK-Pelle-WAK-LRK10L-1 family [Helianthus annuus]|uniref:Transferase, protein kinase RLK-Pelle-WAK-LRK10L-1 family n=2 Tax=Helianthus annuus TaxID=4232 RepID=A0A9K3DVC4_HELAN|nr:LEAF RUST 10 DISEASE-RESISTANCE LOCUS RECEPTOR-LIKE PROTEIN KINASE-like 1.2 [Helianthus annuus]KAF5762119.1 putative transferase, protein kinase RLK-Pelle-WAK-LRK10L-1 family [Helianthus annuus]KAJ0462248.1 putative transferase, protein kinase RLK-Pelle-WAK-LRK10L-1 family [Helianthus annuus]KAJ0837936.1 putative transferase, protein kinase RLK-Pelle-WAK-LRK10L-1 family [Helianthus annuus]